MMSTSKPISILLVDDDEINNFISIKLIKKALVYTEITACLDGSYAINELLDIQAKNPIDPLGKSKIYIISSSVFSNDINKAKSYNLVKDFISKPLNVDKIKELFAVEKTV
jgi:hypothetical protein